MSTAMIERLREATPEIAGQIGELLKQLTSKAQPLTVERLERMLASSSAVYVARVDGVIVGTVCRVDMRHPVRTKCWIEDLVVDEGHRGQQIARRLMESAIGEAPDDAVSISLNSNISRVQSHRLYRGLGFAVREETRIWLLKLER